MWRRNDQEGFVLMVTLWVLVILGVMLTNLAYQVRVESVVERWALNQSTLRWAARGGVHLAAAQVREHVTDDYHSPQAEWWSDEELFHDQQIGAAQVSLLRPGQLNEADEIEVVNDGEADDGEDAGNVGDDTPKYGLDDEESRLNINVAGPRQLMGFPGISTVMAEAIVRYRRELEEEDKEQKEERDTPLTSSREDETDEESTPLVQGPIRSLRDLLNVEEVTEELLFEKREDEPPLATLLTTVSSGKVNINSAPPSVLTAVGLNEGQLNTVLAQRKEDPFTSMDAVKALLGQRPKRWQRLEKFLDVRSSTFRLVAQAHLPNQERAYHTEATLYSGGPKLTFIRWKEY